MITRLTIKNFAIIKDVDISFENKFNVLTGETGAGKSMITGAISLLMGSRSSVDFIRNGEKHCEICGYFSNLPKYILTKLDELDIDIEEELFIRRIIKKESTSRIFINSVPVSIYYLQNLMGNYFSILSQHQNQSLFKTNVQLEILDTFLGLEKPRTELSSIYKQMLLKKKKLSELINKEQEISKRTDYLNFQINEINEIEPKQNEDIELGTQVQKADVSINILQLLNNLNSFLNEDNNSISNTVVKSIIDLNKYSNVDDNLNLLIEKLNKIVEITDDSLIILNKLTKDFDIEEEKLENIKFRFAEIKRLKKKFNCPDIKSLLDEYNNMKNELASLNKFDQELVFEKSKYLQLESNFLEKAEILSKKRAEGLNSFSSSIEDNLKFLSMEKASFFVEINKVELSEYGIDNIVFKISTNPGEPLKSINKIASGGELSRIMLAIQSATTQIYKYGIQIYE